MVLGFCGRLALKPLIANLNLLFCFVVLLKTSCPFKQSSFTLKLQFQSRHAALKFPVHILSQGRLAMLFDRDYGMKDSGSGHCFSSRSSFAPQMRILFLITFGALLRAQFIVGIKFQHRLFKILLLFLPVNSHN